MTSTTLSGVENPPAESRLWSLVSWPVRHIRWKIVLPYALLTALLAAAGSYLVTDMVTGSLEERFDNQLAEAGRVASDGIVQKERQHLEIVRAVSFTDGVADAAAEADETALATLVAPIAVNSGIERIEVLGPDGQRLQTFARSEDGALEYAPLVDDDDPSAWPPVQEVLAGQVDQFGDKHAGIVETADGFVLYTAGPIRSNGEIAGVTLVGTTLETLARDLKELALADVTFYDFEGNPLASTFAIENATESEADISANPDAAEDALNGATVREERTLFERGYDLVYGRMIVRNSVVGLYSAGLPTNFIFDAGSTTRTQVLVLFAVAMAAVLAIGFFVTHRLTAPILRLVRTSRQVAAGDLTVRSGIRSSDEIGVLATSFDEMTEKLQRQHLSTVRALTSAIDARDPYTLGHSVRVGQLSMMLGRQLGLEDKILSRLEIGGYLHDIGKIGIRDAVLLKPANLTPEERSIIEEHPTIGLSILEAVDLPEEVLEFVEGHHERLNGTGYPRGLRGPEISIVKRIGAVADMYDAITTERPYRKPSTPDEALSMLRSEAGTLLDPQVVNALAMVLREWESRRQAETALRGFKLPELDHRKVTI
jgi:putative nucleotidyltransferase with HDIG domain